MQYFILNFIKFLLILIILILFLYYFFIEEKVDVNKELTNQDLNLANNDNAIENDIAVKDVYLDTVFPVNNYTISSWFWPRLKASEWYRYDFHRWIDIHWEKWADVLTIADWEIYRMYIEWEEWNPYTNWWTTVIIKHTLDKPFDFHNEKYYTIYSLYMHLDSINEELYQKYKNENWKIFVKKGDNIWTLWQTWTTWFNHVHFEIRVWVTCSREYQLRNPDLNCSKKITENWDPHINPYIFLNYEDLDTTHLEILSNWSPIKVKVYSYRNELDFNKIKFEYIWWIKVIDFNNRIWIPFNDIDNNLYDWIEITPLKFNSSSNMYEIIFTLYDIDSLKNITITDINWKSKNFIFKN